MVYFYWLLFLLIVGHCSFIFLLLWLLLLFCLLLHTWQFFTVCWTVFCNRLCNFVIFWRVLVFYLEAIRLLADHLDLVEVFFLHFASMDYLSFDNILRPNLSLYLLILLLRHGAPELWVKSLVCLSDLPNSMEFKLYSVCSERVISLFCFLPFEFHQILESVLLPAQYVVQSRTEGEFMHIF